MLVAHLERVCVREGARVEHEGLALIARAPSRTQTRSRWATSTAGSTRRRSKRWHRDRMVTGTLRISVVAKMNLACGGGSSSVFRRALNAPLESMCTSSMT